MSKNCVHKTVLVLGIFELLISISVTVCGIFGFIFHSFFYFLGHGIWGGVWLGLTSFFAITAGRYQSKSLHVTHMVFAIISCVIIVPAVSTLFGTESSNDAYQRRGTLFDEKCWRCFSYKHVIVDSSDYPISFRSDCPDACQPDMRVLIVEISAAVLCGLLFVILIISASFTCCAVCNCCGHSSTNGIIYPNTQDNVVMYTCPVQQQRNFPIEAAPPYPFFYYPSAPSSSYMHDNNQQQRPPPYHPSFSTSLAEIENQKLGIAAVHPGQ